MVELQLSQKPDKETILALGLKSGDKSISIAEGSRLVFNEKNWNQPASVIFQLDPKLRETSAAIFEIRSGNLVLSWSVTFLLLAAMFLVFGIYHKFVLPRPERDQPGGDGFDQSFCGGIFPHVRQLFSETANYRDAFIPAPLPFWRSAVDENGRAVFCSMAASWAGLGLTTGQVGFVYGTVGIIALTCGGLTGGIVASKYGLKSWLWPMIFIMHLPDLVFIYLANMQPRII